MPATCAPLKKHAFTVLVFEFPELRHYNGLLVPCQWSGCLVAAVLAFFGACLYFRHI